MCHIGNVGPSGLLNEVELSHDVSIIEALAERRGGDITAQDLRGQSGSLSRRGVLLDLDVVDNAVDDLRLCQIDLAIVIFLDVDSQVTLYVDLVLDV